MHSTLRQSYIHRKALYAKNTKQLTFTYSQSDTHFLLERVLHNQSRPSKSPSPVVAQADWMNHCLLLMVLKPSLSTTSAAVIAFGKSCFFASTKTTAFFISSSLSI